VWLNDIVQMASAVRTAMTTTEEAARRGGVFPARGATCATGIAPSGTAGRSRGDQLGEVD